VQVYSRVAIHFASGISSAPRSDTTKTGYESEHYDEACKLNIRCRPGAVICSPAFVNKLNTHSSAGDFKMVAKADDAFRLTRQAEPVTPRSNDNLNRVDGEVAEPQGEGDGDDDENWEEQWDQGMGLCSSNWCAWIINTGKISMGNKIGEGNFGKVVAGSYFGTKVAVKQLFKTKLDDLALTKMRKEAAILSGLDHPNIVKLIGLCVSDGGPMLVMELVPRGNLRAILADSAVKLPWKQKMAMLRDAALGLSYLHSRGIIHRDIKSSNLLVEKNLSVKVGDFGFATAKQDNGTQTRCGTPCWTAPEIISGNGKYTEKADVYSFAIVMWEVLTRKAPYQDKNMMTVALNVINGDRPLVPSDCPKAFGDVMQRAWKAKPEKRPQMEDLLMYFNSELGTEAV
jgi:tRNA A-37 threonylcarbamoyl transferase component Bud32